MSDHSYAAFLFSAVIFLAAAAWGVRRGRMPWELFTLVLLVASSLIFVGIVWSKSWKIEGVFARGEGLKEETADWFLILATSPTYLEAVGLSPRDGPFLRSGLRVEKVKNEIVILYSYRGIGGGEKRRAALEFVTRTGRNLPGLLFAASLEAAASSRELLRLLKKPPPLGRPVRLLLREIVPELKDRFPTASGSLTDLSRKIGAPPR